MKRHVIWPVVVLFSISFIISCGGGGGSEENGGPSDIVAPTTTAVPGEGTYGTIQNVTLTADEPCTIYYTMDGSDPSVGGSSTYSGISPISNVQITQGITELKFFSVDQTGNQEVFKSETYTVDLTSPTITFTSTPTGALGLLGNAAVTWESNEDGDYVVELGGTGSAGSGIELASGSLLSTSSIDIPIRGVQLAFGSPTPLWIYVEDHVGHTGSASLDLNLKSLETIDMGVFSDDVEVTPDGKKAYMTIQGNLAAAIDTDLMSPSYHSVIATVSINSGFKELKITPDGTRVYITQVEGSLPDNITVISTSSDTVITTIPAAYRPYGLAFNPNGLRAYTGSYNRYVDIIDTDPTSLNYNQSVDNILMHTLFLMGTIGISPDNTKMIVNWQGSIAHGVDVFNVDPASGTYKATIGSPVPVIAGFGGQVTVSPTANIAYITSPLPSCGLCSIDMETATILSNVTAGGISILKITPDGNHLLNSALGVSNIHVFDASDLSLLGTNDIGYDIMDLAVTPDGTRAYCTLDSSNEVLMIPLK